MDYFWQKLEKFRFSTISRNFCEISRKMATFQILNRNFCTSLQRLRKDKIVQFVKQAKKSKIERRIQKIQNANPFDSNIGLRHQVSCKSHNVEILEFFCHSDFTWNLFDKFWALKGRFGDLKSAKTLKSYVQYLHIHSSWFSAIQILREIHLQNLKVLKLPFMPF